VPLSVDVGLGMSCPTTLQTPRVSLRRNDYSLLSDSRTMVLPTLEVPKVILENGLLVR